MADIPNVSVDDINKLLQEVSEEITTEKDKEINLSTKSYKITAALTGVKHAPERVAKMKIAGSTEESKARLIAANKRRIGTKVSEETLAKKKGIKLSEEHKAKIRASLIGKKKTKEAIAKSAAARTGAIRSAEAKAKIGAVHKGKMLSDEHKAKITAGLIASYAEKKRGPVSDETKAKLALASKKHWESKKKEGK